jgi:ribose 1,5-bisphosphokinase PhnN
VIVLDASAAITVLLNLGASAARLQERMGRENESLDARLARASGIHTAAEVYGGSGAP